MDLRVTQSLPLTTPASPGAREVAATRATDGDA
jgi:hypothetical protein